MTCKVKYKFIQFGRRNNVIIHRELIKLDLKQKRIYEKVDLNEEILIQKNVHK